MLRVARVKIRVCRCRSMARSSKIRPQTWH
jgi:hypothetical protein